MTIPPIINIKDDLLRKLAVTVTVPVVVVFVLAYMIIVGAYVEIKSEMPSVFKAFASAWKGKV